MVSYQSLELNTSPSHAISTILVCFQPIFMQEAFSHAFCDAYVLQINCQKWGDIGKIVCLGTSPGKTEPRFDPPQPISPNELPKYEILIRKEFLGLRGRLAELFGQTEIVNNTLSQALYEKRLQRQQEFKVWLFSRLQIFGYRDLYLDPILNASTEIDEHFDFPIKGTPAQFGVMLRQFATTLRDTANFQRLGCQILLPGGRKDTGSIPPDANPIEIRLSHRKDLLSIHAHILPSDGTLLRIRLTGDRNLWELWDRIRDELEKLGWFSLPNFPKLPAPEVTAPMSQQQESNPLAEIWMSIPDIGANHEILRNWHKGLTCEQIGTRVSLSEKTVNNRIHQLRKEFGTQIVPYRKSNYLKNPREKPS